MTLTDAASRILVPPDLQVAAATVCGAHHRRAGRQNQDAFCVSGAAAGLVATVADGCGSAPASEVGAHLGAALWTRALARRLQHGAPVSPALFEAARAEVLVHLRTLVAALAGGAPGAEGTARAALAGRAPADDGAAALHDYFLFTIVCAVVTGQRVVVVAIGDGLVAFNDERTTLGPFPNNQPPYLAYALSGPSPIITVLDRPVADLDTLVIGTDGLVDFAERAGQPLPGAGAGAGDRLPDLAELCADDRIFTNLDALRRLLARANRDVVRADWDRQRLERSAPLLPDDTTLVAIRRRR